MKLNLLIPVNSDEYNPELLLSLHIVFPNCRYHFCIMGKNPHIVTKDTLPPNTYTTKYITSIGFNYSFAINVILRELMETMDANSLIAISNPWYFFSPTQLALEVEKLDFTKNFVTIDVYDDMEEKPLEISSNTRLHLSITLRSKALKEKNSTKNCPILITKLMYLTVVETGLNEQFFTGVSIYNTINQLTKIGLIHKLSSVSALCLIGGNKYPPRLFSSDSILLDELKNINSQTSFINSNYNEVWGVEEKLKYLQYHENILSWKNLKKRTVRYIPSLDLSKIETNLNIQRNNVECEVIEYPDKNTLKEVGILGGLVDQIKGNIITNDLNDSITSIVPSDSEIMDALELLQNKESNINIIEEDEPKIIHNVKNLKNNDFLIMIQSTVKDAICASPLINKLSKLYGPVNILTNRKTSAAIQLLKNEKVNKIFDISDMDTGYLDPSKFVVIRTNNCQINLRNMKITNYYECAETQYPSVYNNYYWEYNRPLIEMEALDNMYCSFNEKYNMENTIVVCVSNKQNNSENKTNPVFPNIDMLISKLGNLGHKITCVHLLGEKKMVGDTKYKSRLNIKYFYEQNILDAAGFIERSKFVITHPETDLTWISIALKEKIFLLENKLSNTIIDSPNINKIKYNNFDISEIVRFICTKK